MVPIILARVITMMARPETILAFVARSGFSLDRKNRQRDADDAQVNQEFFMNQVFGLSQAAWELSRSDKRPWLRRAFSSNMKNGRKIRKKLMEADNSVGPNTRVIHCHAD
jgi:hypothetical protein